MRVQYYVTRWPVIVDSMNRKKWTVTNSLSDTISGKWKIFAYFCPSSSPLCDVQLWRKINVITGKASVTSNEDNYVSWLGNPGPIWHHYYRKSAAPPLPHHFFLSFKFVNDHCSIMDNCPILFSEKQKTTRVLWGFPDLLNGINAPINRPLVWTVTRTPWNSISFGMCFSYLKFSLDSFFS